jgi:hypothetical protein
VAVEVSTSRCLTVPEECGTPFPLFVSGVVLPRDLPISSGKRHEERHRKIDGDEGVGTRELLRRAGDVDVRGAASRPRLRDYCCFHQIGPSVNE